MLWAVRDGFEPDLGERSPTAIYDLERQNPRDLAVAVLHCTAGDLGIAFLYLIAALVFLGDRDWLTRRYTVVAIGATVLGVAYTIYSERMNLEGGGWAYSNAMPIVPPFGIGLSPVLQWLVVPPVGLAVARRVLASAEGRPRDQACPCPAGDRVDQGSDRRSRD